MLLIKLLPGKVIIAEVWFLFRCICLHGRPATAGCRPLLSADATPTRDEVDSPLHRQEWDRCLAEHPDQHFRAYIINGIRFGFRVGYAYHHSP